MSDLSFSVVSLETLPFSILCNNKMAEAAEETKKIIARNKSMEPAERLLRSVRIFYHTSANVDDCHSREFDLRKAQTERVNGKDCFILQANEDGPILSFPLAFLGDVKIWIAGFFILCKIGDVNVENNGVFRIELRPGSAIYLIGRLENVSNKIMNSLINGHDDRRFSEWKNSIGSKAIFVLDSISISQRALSPIMDSLTNWTRVTPTHLYARSTIQAIKQLGEACIVPHINKIIKDCRFAIDRNTMLNNCRSSLQSITISCPGDEFERFSLKLEDGESVEPQAQGWKIKTSLAFQSAEEHIIPVTALRGLELLASNILLSAKDSNTIRQSAFLRNEDSFLFVPYNSSVVATFIPSTRDRDAFNRDIDGARQYVIDQIAGLGDVRQPRTEFEGLGMTLVSICVGTDVFRPRLQALGLVTEDEYVSEGST